MGGCMDSLHNSHLSLDLQAGKPCDGLGLQLALAWSTPVQGAKLTSIQSHEEPSSLLKGILCKHQTWCCWASMWAFKMKGRVSDPSHG